MATKTIVITSGLKRSLLQPFHGCVNLTGIRAERLKEILEPAEGGPRKRRRLTHLSTEEKLLRRKLKNRVAAQSARDRKKVLMSELEDRIALLEKENELLEKENLELRIHASDLVEENTQLRDHVTKSGALIEMSGVHSVESVAPEPSCESAVLAIVPLQQERVQNDKQQCHAWLLLVISLTFFLNCWNRLAVKSDQKVKFSPQLLASVAELLSQSRNRQLKWWGPKQRGWNPSMN